MDISRGRGYGYVKADGTICMERCFSCGAANYALAVSSGACHLCGFVAGKHEPTNEKHVIVSDKKRACMECAGYGRDGKPCYTCRSVNPSFLGLSFPSTPYALVLKVFVYLEKEENK